MALQHHSVPKLLRYFYYYRLKRIEEKHVSTMGTHPNGGAMFKGRPNLPHGLMGIGISAYAVIGEDVTICPFVRIAIKGKHVREAARIGDHVYIGADATIIGNITIGDYAVIGAGAVVTKDVTEHSVVAGNPARESKGAGGHDN